MKFRKLMPALCVLMTAYLAGCQESANSAVNSQNETTDSIMTYDQIVHDRYSCKRFDPTRQLSEQQLNAILEAGRVAPTAKNLQEQRVYVVQSAEVLQQIDSVCPCRYNAPTCLVVAYDSQNVFTYPNSTRDSGTEDATIVATHMLLAATANGVNSCWINYFDPAAMAATLGLPANEKVVMMLDLGFANEDGKPLPNHFDRKELKETVTFL